MTKPLTPKEIGDVTILGISTLGFGYLPFLVKAAFRYVREKDNEYRSGGVYQ